MTENRFLEAEREVRNLRTHHRRQHKSNHRYGHAPGLSGAESLAVPFSATDRVLVVLIENGGIDLGLPELVDRLLAAVPGGSLLPDSVKTGLVNALRDRLRAITDNLLETAELTLNRFSAAKPDPYGDVAVLRDGSATYDELKRTLISEATAGKIVDLVILTHGANDWISVADGIDGAKIRAIKTEAGRPIPLRSVYMMNCVGSSLNQAWLDAGAKTSAGALRNNYLPEPTTHFFWTNWRAGQSFEAAVTGAYRQTIGVMNDTVRGFLVASPIPGTSAIAAALDFADFDFVRDSAPVVQGQRTVTIGSDDLTFTEGESRASSLATMIVPIRTVKSLSETAGPPQRTLSDAGLAFVRGFEQVAPGDQRVLDAQRAVTEAVSVPLTQNQVDALVSFVLGIGCDAFRSSTLLRELNASHYAAVPDELRKWIKVQQDGRVADSPDLVRRRGAEADLFARADAPAAAVAASMGAVDYTVPGLVAPLQQPSPMTCWATVIAMMTSWRRQQSIAPRDAVAPGGQEFLAKFDAGQPLDAASAGRLYQALGLVAIRSLNPSIDGWEQYLRLYGPLYVDIGYPQVATTHAVIVTGISGDGTAGGTTITYVDPASGTVVNRRFGEFLAQYETPAAVDWPYVITHWPAPEGASQSLPMNGVYTYEKSVEQPIEKAQFAILGIAIEDAIQIGLGAVSVAQAAGSASQGTFTLTWDKAQRLLTQEARGAMPGSRAATQRYSRRLFDIQPGEAGLAHALITITWEGNAYGEIGTPVIERDLAGSSEWSHSSFSCAVTKLDRIPPANTDPRAWPIVYTYQGTFDPMFNGYFEFSGEYQIDAFGGIKWNRHQVVSRSLLDATIAGRPEDYVARGPDVASTVPDIPAEQMQYLRAHPAG